ncbi:hypothetical protein Tco_1003250 [Tanacetum coccineum]|uniref:Uncharacterized protein n=1 Tax=Tanacetum coccineum TaxID=301880 RepID=A0ABQ5F8X5_9ASTR
MDLVAYHRSFSSIVIEDCSISSDNGKFLKFKTIMRQRRMPLVHLLCIKADEKKLDDIRVVRDFPEVFPDEIISTSRGADKMYYDLRRLGIGGLVVKRDIAEYGSSVLTEDMVFYCAGWYQSFQTVDGRFTSPYGKAFQEAHWVQGLDMKYWLSHPQTVTVSTTTYTSSFVDEKSSFCIDEPLEIVERVCGVKKLIEKEESQLSQSSWNNSRQGAECYTWERGRQFRKISESFCVLRKNQRFRLYLKCSPIYLEPSIDIIVMRKLVMDSDLSGSVNPHLSLGHSLIGWPFTSYEVFRVLASFRYCTFAGQKSSFIFCIEVLEYEEWTGAVADINEDVILSNESKESANETDDADESDMDLSDDNLNRDDDAARYGVFMHNKSTATPNSAYLSMTVTSSSLDFIQTLLDETPANELMDFISHPVYIGAQTTSVVHNPEGNPELTSYISGASEVPLGTHVDVLATQTLLQEMFPDKNAHHLSSSPAIKTKINFKKAVAQKFREYDQKLEALTNFNVFEAFEKAVQAKVLTEIKKLLPTHIPSAIANYVRPRLNTSVLEVMKTKQINLFTQSSTSTDGLSEMDLKLNLLN